MQHTFFYFVGVYNKYIPINDFMAINKANAILFLYDTKIY